MRIIRLVFPIIILLSLILTVQADDFNPLVYQYSNPEVTVVFSAPLEVTSSRQKDIADSIAGIDTNTSLTSDSISPNNIICTLFGHDIAPEVTVTATHHKVKVYNPRCLMELYHVTYCKRCDYTVQNLENDFYIICCPED